METVGEPDEIRIPREDEVPALTPVEEPAPAREAPQPPSELEPEAEPVPA